MATKVRVNITLDVNLKSSLTSRAENEGQSLSALINTLLHNSMASDFIKARPKFMDEGTNDTVWDDLLEDYEKILQDNFSETLKNIQALNSSIDALIGVRKTLENDLNNQIKNM